MLHELALGDRDCRELSARGLYVASWSLADRLWTYDVRPVDTEITAHTRRVVDTPTEAVTEALHLRDQLISAAGAIDVRGFVAAETVNDDDLAVRGWSGAVKVVIESDT